MKNDHQISIQKKLMNEMMEYLEKETYSIVIHGNYKKTTLTYNRKTSIMHKRLTVWNFEGKIIEQSEKEKALGGANGNSMFNAIRDEANQKARNRVLKSAVRRELEENGIDLELIED